MSKNLTTMISEVLVNCDVTDKVAVGVTNLKSYITGWLNDGYQFDHEKALWPEAILNNVEVIVPANTQDVSLPGNLDLIYALRNGTTPLKAIDPTTLNQIDASLNSYTGTPYCFINKGRSGFRLIGSYTSATTLNCDGKEAFSKLINDLDEPVLPNEKAYVAFASYRALTVLDRDHPRLVDYKEHWLAFKSSRESQSFNQQANQRKITPVDPWTGGVGGWGNSSDPNGTSIVPITGLGDF